jgi:hypothetical protein
MQEAGADSPPAPTTCTLPIFIANPRLIDHFVEVLDINPITISLRERLFITEVEVESV